MTSNARGWDHRVDWLRVGAILLILVHHSDDYGIQFLRLNETMARLDDILLTWIPLAVFFALSGYLAGRSGRMDASEHLRRRIGRLYIPFAVALVLLWAFAVFELNANQVLVNLFLLGPWEGRPVGTLWFVEVLLYYQALYAFWLLVRDRLPVWALPLVFTATTVVLAAIAHVLGWTADARLLAYLPAFAGGAVLGIACHDPSSRTPVAALAWALGCFLLPAAAMTLPLWREPAEWGALIWATLATLVVSGIFWLMPRGTRSPRLLHLIAYGSFMAYLLHRFIFRLAAEAAALWSDPGVVVLLAIPVTLWGGVALQRLVDRAPGEK